MRTLISPLDRAGSALGPRAAVASDAAVTLLDIDIQLAKDAEDPFEEPAGTALGSSARLRCWCSDD